MMSVVRPPADEALVRTAPTTPGCASYAKRWVLLATTLGSSIAFLEGFYYNPRIDREVLEAHHEGLICLSGCLAGEFNQYILADKPKEAKGLAEWFARVFNNDFYIEIQNNGIGLQDQCTPVAAEIADKLGVPLVATADAHYLCQEDAEAHDVDHAVDEAMRRCR